MAVSSVNSAEADIHRSPKLEILFTLLKIQEHFRLITALRSSLKNFDMLCVETASVSPLSACHFEEQSAIKNNAIISITKTLDHRIIYS